MAHALAADTLAALAGRDDAPLAVGFSGGGDSSALLDVLAGLPLARARGLRSIHVDHGLDRDSARWAEHCRAFCAARAVPIEVRRVTVADERGEGIEAAARRARYAAFAAALDAGETLILAHHRDDQIETVLLKLLRGAGPEGLAGMRAERAFAGTRLWRPWLDVTRAEIEAWLEQRGIDYLRDPANADPRFTRNRLRQRVVPLLRDAWPSSDDAILHSAAACRAAADHLAIAADSALATIADGRSIDAIAWLALDDAVRVTALQRWLHELALPAPTTAQRHQIEHQSRADCDGSIPEVRWPGAVLRLWRGHWHASAPLPVLPAAWHARWNGAAPLALPLGRLEPASAPVAADFEVRLPAAGQRIRPVGSSHHHPLSELFRQRGVAPWLRPFWPLLFVDGELVAVPGLRLSEAGRAIFGNLAGAPTWRRD